MADPDRFRVDVLGAQHDRSGFSSGVEVLDRYLKVQASQDRRKNVAAPFVLCLEDGSIAGYYTLSSTAIEIGHLPEQVTRKLPRYPLIPATLLGRLAVDVRHRGMGCGAYLLADALYRASSAEIASFAVVVDAKDEMAHRFYRKQSFLPFPDLPMKLFRPMQDIKALFGNDR